MKTYFRTNVDCCKNFMPRLNEYMDDAQPNLGDHVVVLEESNKVVELKVVGRTWKTRQSYTRNEFETILEIQLQLTSFWTDMGLSKFEAHVKGRPE